jgi:hypothetical protein
MRTRSRQAKVKATGGVVGVAKVEGVVSWKVAAEIQAVVAHDKWWCSNVVDTKFCVVNGRECGLLYGRVVFAGAGERKVIFW